MPTSVVRCTNQACEHAGSDRRVQMTEVGPGLYAVPTISCACGHRPRVLDHWIPDGRPSAPENATKAPPEVRTKGRRRG